MHVPLMVDAWDRVYSAAGAREIRSDAFAAIMFDWLLVWVKCNERVCTYISESETCRGDRFANRLLPAGSHHFFLFVFFSFFPRPMFYIFLARRLMPLTNWQCTPQRRFVGPVNGSPLQKNFNEKKNVPSRPCRWLSSSP